MTVSSVSVRLLAAGVLSCTFTAAQASFTFATLSGASNVATYTTSVNGSVDTFSDLTINSDLNRKSLSRSTAGAAGIGYSVSTESDLQTVQTSSIPGSALTVANNTDTLTFGSFTAAVTSFGIQFYLTDLTPSAVGGGSMKVTAQDVFGLSQSYTYTQSSFTNSTQQYLPLLVTLASTAPLAFVQLTPPATGANPDVFATADNLVLAAVPEPSTWLTMLAGGALVLGSAARRRR